MSRYAAFLLFLAIGLGFSHVDDLDYPFFNDPSEDLFAGSTSSDKTTTTTETTTLTTTTAETTTTTTVVPTTTKPTTTTTTEPTTTTTTEPTTTTTTEPTTTTTTEPTTTTTTEPTTTGTEAPTTNATATTETTPTTTAESNTTSSAPNTTTTAATTTVAPTTPPPQPETIVYKILDSNNATCLMVKFGLRIGYTVDKYEEVNFPNTTVAHGSCGENKTELVLQSDPLTVTFTFSSDTKKFNLHALNVTGKTSSGVAFSQANINMSLWQASLGSSYMCKKEQTFNITDSLKIFTFELQVQPFGVKKDSFSTAQECPMDDTSILIPIVVGAALAGLILIVVIAYLIGRRKTYVGYQTL